MQLFFGLVCLTIHDAYSPDNPVSCNLWGLGYFLLLLRLCLVPGQRAPLCIGSMYALYFLQFPFVAHNVAGVLVKYVKYAD